VVFAKIITEKTFISLQHIDEIEKLSDFFFFPFFYNLLFVLTKKNDEWVRCLLKFF